MKCSSEWLQQRKCTKNSASVINCNKGKLHVPSICTLATQIYDQHTLLTEKYVSASSCSWISLIWSSFTEISLHRNTEGKYLTSQGRQAIPDQGKTKYPINMLLITKKFLGQKNEGYQVRRSAWFNFQFHTTWHQSIWKRPNEICPISQQSPHCAPRLEPRTV